MVTTNFFCRLVPVGSLTLIGSSFLIKLNLETSQILLSTILKLSDPQQFEIGLLHSYEECKSEVVRNEK